MTQRNTAPSTWCVATMLGLVLAPALVAADVRRLEVRAMTRAEEFVEWRLPPCFPSHDVSVVTKRLSSDEAKAYVARGRAVHKKDFVLTPVEEIVTMAVTLRDRADAASRPTEIFVDVYTYATALRALVNRGYMLEAPHWMEPGFGAIPSFADRLGFRVASAGSDDVIRRAERCVGDALAGFLQLTQSDPDPKRESSRTPAPSPNPSPSPSPSPATGADAPVAPMSSGGPVRSGGAGILWLETGDGFGVSVPEGWILDNQALKDQGIGMFFYPAGVEWKGDASRLPVFAYVIATLRRNSSVTVAALVQRRMVDLRLDRHATTAIEREPDSGDAGEKVTLIRYSSPGMSRYERVAYIEDDRVIFAVILSASSREALDRSSALVDHVVKDHQRVVR